MSYQLHPASFSLAIELARLRADVLVTVTRQAAIAAQSATQTIPVVFMVVPDPVGTKLIDSLARPGVNMTGMTNMALELQRDKPPPDRLGLPSSRSSYGVPPTSNARSRPSFRVTCRAFR